MKSIVCHFEMSFNNRNIGFTNKTISLTKRNTKPVPFQRVHDEQQSTPTIFGGQWGFEWNRSGWLKKRAINQSSYCFIFNVIHKTKLNSWMLNFSI